MSLTTAINPYQQLTSGLWEVTNFVCQDAEQDPERSEQSAKHFVHQE